jgi:hypothetical protein
MGAFEYRQAEEIRDVFARYYVRHLFLGKSGAILLGFGDTTQDADVFIEKSPENGRKALAALRQLGFDLTEEESNQIERGKDFVQLKNGPFDIDLIFAPDVSNGSRMPGSATSKSRVSTFATLTTSSPAKKQRVEPKIANRCRG